MICKTLSASDLVIADLHDGPGVKRNTGAVPVFPPILTSGDKTSSVIHLHKCL